MKQPTHKRFEIIYSDGSVVRGRSAKQFNAAPDDDVQFVIIEFSDGHIERQKGQDVYEYRNAKKAGTQTDDDNYKKLKARSMSLSRLM